MKKRLMALVAICFLFMIQGCKQDMDLNPQDYFSGQQLELAKAIEEGDVGRRLRQTATLINLESRI